MTLSRSAQKEVESTTLDLGRLHEDRAPEQGAIRGSIHGQPASLNAPTLPAPAWWGGSRPGGPLDRPTAPVHSRQAFGGWSEFEVTKRSQQPAWHGRPDGIELAITRPSATATAELARAELAATKLSHGTPRLWRERGAELAGRVAVLSGHGAPSVPNLPSVARFAPYLATHIPRGAGGYALLDIPGLGPVYAQAAPVPPGWRMHVNQDPLYLKLLGDGKPPWICWSDLSHPQRRLVAETLTEQQRIAFRPECIKVKNLRTRMATFALDCLAWLMVDDEGRTVPVPLDEDLYPTPEQALEAARQRWAYPGRREGKRKGFARARAAGDRT